MDVPYTALARRYRPQAFTEVVGQDRIATTLRNAIVEGRVAHAYLFTGARGVGKTSMARIFAKALNCPNAVDAVPCNECEICRGISAGQDVDVSEIDGASNRGIDDIRSLRANVNVRSMRSKYKVYIVDEVHMLTKEAFNALLKTLEEPPPGVKFVFCTTEPNKVPDTILSRCQRFDFGTIATDDIMSRLQQLADAEGFQVEPAALELVARRAAGSMRDSQSLFDQLLAFGSQAIVADDVHRLLGTAPDERLVELAQALLDRRSDVALGRLQSALDGGVQLEPFIDQMLSYFRDLMVLAAGATEVSLLSVSRDQQPRLAEQATVWGVQTVVAALEILSETKQRMQRSTFGRALADLALVRIALLRELDRLDDLIAALKAGGGAVSSTPRIPTTARPAQPPAGPAAAQKKTLEPVERAPESVLSEGKTEVPSIAWEPNAAPALLAALQARFADITGTYLRQAHSSAISGPNTLEILFPTRYDLGRRACERPEVLAKLESALRELTGQTIRVRLRAIAVDPQPESTEAAPKPTNGRRKIIDEPSDPLVAEVGRVFGVEQWSVQEMMKSWAADSGESES